MKWIEIWIVGMVRWIFAPPSCLGSLFGLAMVCFYINMFIDLFREPEYMKRRREYEELQEKEAKIQREAEREYQEYLQGFSYDEKYEIVSYYCDGIMEGMTEEYVERYFDVISRGKEETLPRYNKERHIDKYGQYAKRYLYIPKDTTPKPKPSDSFKHMFWW